MFIFQLATLLKILVLVKAARNISNIQRTENLKNNYNEFVTNDSTNKETVEIFNKDPKQFVSKDVLREDEKLTELIDLFKQNYEHFDSTLKNDEENNVHSQHKANIHDLRNEVSSPEKVTTETNTKEKTASIADNKDLFREYEKLLENNSNEEMASQYPNETKQKTNIAITELNDDKNGNDFQITESKTDVSDSNRRGNGKVRNKRTFGMNENYIKIKLYKRDNIQLSDIQTPLDHLKHFNTRVIENIDNDWKNMVEIFMDYDDSLTSNVNFSPPISKNILKSHINKDINSGRHDYTELEDGIGESAENVMENEKNNDQITNKQHAETQDTKDIKEKEILNSAEITENENFTDNDSKDETEEIKEEEVLHMVKNYHQLVGIPQAAALMENENVTKTQGTKEVIENYETNEENNYDDLLEEPQTGEIAEYDDYTEEMIEEEVLDMVKNYHQLIGIPQAAAIMENERRPFLRIVNGQPARLGDFPYVAGLVIPLLNGPISMCGASVISWTRLLTAAHCWKDSKDMAKHFEVVLGSLTLFEGGTRLTTKDVVTHPHFRMDHVRNDIAIIKTNETIHFNLHIGEIKLPYGNLLSKDFVTKRAKVAGYGKLRNDQQVSTKQSLSYKKVTIIANAICRRVFGRKSLSKSNICAVAVGGITCPGDSGSPMAYGHRRRGRILIGITSFGSENCEKGLPAAFVRITSYVDWIKQLMK